MFQLRSEAFDIEMKMTASSAPVSSIIIRIQFNTICYPEDWSHTPHEVVMAQILNQFWVVWPGAPSPVKDHIRSLID